MERASISHAACCWANIHPFSDRRALTMAIVAADLGHHLRQLCYLVANLLNLPGCALQPAGQSQQQRHAAQSTSRPSR